MYCVDCSVMLHPILDLRIFGWRTKGTMTAASIWGSRLVLVAQTEYILYQRTEPNSNRVWVTLDINATLPRFYQTLSEINPTRARGVGAMADFVTSSAKYRLELLNGENYFIWARRMKKVYSSKLCWDIIDGVEIVRTGMSLESWINFFHMSQTEVSTIVMSIEDECLGSVEDSDNPVELWNELREKYSISVEATAEALHMD